MRRLTLLSFLLLAGCGRYADFTLPAPAPSEPASSFQWVPQPAPVLTRGGVGEWDSGDVLNPSVVHYDGILYNFYSGFDGKVWHTGTAVSTDGVAWRKQGRFLSPDAGTWEGGYIAANGAALRVDGEWLYWYHAGPRERPRIGLARSPDTREWRKPDAPVLDTGPRGSWDERGVADPYVIRQDDVLYMFYLGQDRARRQRLGLARSRDGVRWEKLRANPILELGEPGAFDERGLGEPAVWQSHGGYWMLYTGRDGREVRRLGLARSIDGVRWQKLPAAFSGGEPWNTKVLCDPSVVVDGDRIRVWFGGGDVASPDENLHGQIGLARLIPASAEH